MASLDPSTFANDTPMMGATPPATAGPPSPPIGPRPDKLTPKDLADFARLGIPEELLIAASVRRVNDAEGRKLTGRRDGDMSGIAFDYVSPDTAHVVSRRIRRDHPEQENGQPKNKYISDYGGLKHLFFPPGAKEALTDAETMVVLVESEKASLALTAFARRNSPESACRWTGRLLGMAWKSREGADAIRQAGGRKRAVR